MRQLRSLSLLFVLVGCVFTECTAQEKSFQSEQMLQRTNHESLVQKATNELDTKLSKIDDAVSKAPSDVQEKIKAVEPPAATVGFSDQQKQKLLNAAQSISTEAGKNEQMYQRLGLASIILSAVLALIGSIASFLKMNKVAGIVGLIVVAIVSLSNTYPIASLHNFYRDLKAGADAIVADCTFVIPYTEATYKTNYAQYKLLVVSAGKRPTFGNFQNPADTLKAEMQSVKIAASNVESARDETFKSMFVANQPSDKSKSEKYF